MKRIALFSLFLTLIACRPDYKSQGGTAVPRELPTISPSVGDTLTQPAECLADTVDDPILARDDYGGPDVGDGQFQVTATPQSFNVPQGGTVDVQVTVRRNDGFSGPVRLTVDGLPDGVSASELTLADSELSGTISLVASWKVAVPLPNVARVRGWTALGTKSAGIDLTVRGEPGSADTSFGTGGFVRALEAISAVKEQPDGKLLFTGAVYGSLMLCRLDAEGKPDPAFGSSDGCASIDLGGRVVGQKIAIHHGLILVTGQVQFEGIFVARFLMDGTLDASFGGRGWIVADFGTDAIPNDMLVGADGEIAIAGDINGEGLVGLLRPDGSADTTFGAGGHLSFGDEPAYHLVRLADCRWIAATGTALFAIAPSGTPDVMFGAGAGVVRFATGAAYALAVTADDDILTTWDGMALTRLTNTGGVEATTTALDGGFASDGVRRFASALDLAILADGSVVFGGSDSSDEGRMGIGRRLPDGSPDTTFGTTGVLPCSQGSVGRDLEVLRDGRYVLGGNDELNSGVIVRVWD